jgi:hypothetical protein
MELGTRNQELCDICSRRVFVRENVSHMPVVAASRRAHVFGLHVFGLHVVDVSI